LEIVKKAYCDKALKRMQMAAVAGQRHLKADASIADIAAEEENDWQKTVRRLAQAYSMLAILNGSCHSSQGSAALKEVGQLGDQIAGQGD
jgi:hypothetical protein